MTALIGQRPDSTRATSRAARRRAVGRIWLVADATCGVSSTLSIVSSELAGSGGSCSRTSRPAAAIWPVRRASIRAGSSTVDPRPQLMNTAEGFMSANCSVESMGCVSALSGAWIETKSDRRSSSWSGTGSTPSAVILSSLTYGSYAMTWSPKALARRATAFATFPNEMRPSVWPYSRGIRLSSGQP